MKLNLFFLFILSSFTSVNAQNDSASIELKVMTVAYHGGELSKSLKLANAFLAKKNDEKVYVLKSHILIDMEKFTEAIDNYEVALKYYPNSYVLNLNFGVLLNGFRMNERAIDHITSAFEFAENDGDKSIALTSRAAVLASSREFQQAYEDLHEALKYDSTNIATLVNFGAVCDEIGKPLEGIKHLKKAVELDPEFSGGYANIGYLLQQMGDYASAITYYDKVLELDPNEPLGYSNRAYNYLMLGDDKSAMKDINKSIKLYPTNSYAYMIKGLILLETGKTKNACVEFEKALELKFTEQYGDRVIKLVREHCR